jgi:hypothetical protein
LMRFLLAMLVVLVNAPPAGVSLTSVRTTTDPLWFSNPALGLKGTMTPIPGSRFEVVVVAVGDDAIAGELRQFTLRTADGASFEPIAAGGGADLIFPIDSMPLGRELGQILANDAEVVLTRTSPTSVTLEADPQATLAFVFQVPHAAAIVSLHLPSGATVRLGT